MNWYTIPTTRTLDRYTVSLSHGSNSALHSKINTSYFAQSHSQVKANKEHSQRLSVLNEAPLKRLVVYLYRDVAAEEPSVKHTLWVVTEAHW